MNERRQVERVNGSYRQNPRDEGGGLVTEFPENFVNLAICQEHNETKVIESTGFKFDDRSDLRGCLEVTQSQRLPKYLL